MKPATTASVLLATLIVALLWVSLYWLPFHFPVQPIPVAVIFAMQWCALVLSIALLMLPGAGMLKAALAMAAGAFFNLGGVPSSLSAVPLFYQFQSVMLFICAVTVVVALVRPYLVLALRHVWPVFDRYAGTVDDRVGAVCTALFTTAAWIVAYSIWALFQFGGNPVAWLPPNAGVIMVVLGFQCFAGGTAMLPLDLPTSPGFTFLSSREAATIHDRLRAEGEGESPGAKAPADAQDLEPSSSTAA